MKRWRGVALAALTTVCGCGNGSMAGVPSLSNRDLSPSSDVAPRRSQFPPTPSGIHLNLVFNYLVKNLQREVGLVDIVWGAGAPRPKQVANQFYTPFERDGPYGERAHSVGWWKANHPDWIEYRCDRTRIAFEYGERNVPFDIANPKALDYQRAVAVDPAIDAGYQGVDFDNLALSNYSHRCGHYSTSGEWVAQYTGDYVDPAYSADVLAWAHGTFSHIHGFSKTAIMAINFSYDANFDAARNDDLATHTDEVLDEGGFTNYGTAGHNVTNPGQWRHIKGMIGAIQTNGGCYMENGEEPGLSKDISQAERLWVVANYLLIRNDCTYVWMSGFTKTGAQDYGRILLYPEYRLAVGKPVGAATRVARAWERIYSGGLTLVNPTKAPTTVKLSHRYVDENGNAYSGSIALPATTGQILLLK